MSNLTRASQELFKRSADERFTSLEELSRHCRDERRASQDRWHLPQQVRLQGLQDLVGVALGGDGDFHLNDWSFGQLCKLAGVGKETVNRLSPDTAGRVLAETLPGGKKPLQLLTREDRVRSIHGASYTRLHNADLLQVVRETATDFTPPQQGFNGGTGLYCGEQDMFCLPDRSDRLDGDRRRSLRSGLFRLE